MDSRRELKLSLSGSSRFQRAALRSVLNYDQSTASVLPYQHLFIGLFWQQVASGHPQEPKLQLPWNSEFLCNTFHSRSRSHLDFLGKSILPRDFQAELT